MSAYLEKILLNKSAKAGILRQLGAPDADLTRHVSFPEFVYAICEQPISRMDPHWCPQYYQTMQESITFDFIGKFERFEDDFKNLGRKIAPDFHDYFGSERGHATHADSKLDEYLTSDLKQAIARKYRLDFAYFQYQP